MKPKHPTLEGYIQEAMVSTNRDHLDVALFHHKFKVPVASDPSFLGPKTFEFRFRFMHEELAEFHLAHSKGDMEGAADALIDLAYVIHGTAHMMGLPWPALWEEVQRANMSKVRATSPDQSKRGSALDVIKPEGWEPPNHSRILGEGPWSTHGD